MWLVFCVDLGFMKIKEKTVRNSVLCWLDNTICLQRTSESHLKQQQILWLCFYAKMSFVALPSCFLLFSVTSAFAGELCVHVGKDR